MLSGLVMPWENRWSWFVVVFVVIVVIVIIVVILVSRKTLDKLKYIMHRFVVVFVVIVLIVIIVVILEKKTLDKLKYIMHIRTPYCPKRSIWYGA